MVPRRLYSLPRLARNVLVSLLDQRAGVCADAPRLCASRPAEIGTVDEVVWRQRKVSIRGRAREDVTIRFDGRAPMATASADFDLCLDRPEKSAGLLVGLKSQAGEAVLRFPPPRLAQEIVARIAACPAVLADLWSERRALADFVKSGDQAVAARLRLRFGLTSGPQAACTVPPGFFGGGSVVPAPDAPPIVIVPVFNGHDDVAHLMDRLPLCGMDHHLLLIDDGSDDTRIAPLLARVRDGAPHRVTLFRQAKNRGFVDAVNMGFRHARRIGDGHVVLLNTDTLPPEGWLPRLLAPILRNGSVASVTPLSNCAEILSVPAPGVAAAPDQAMIDVLDDAAQRIAPTYANADVPTGIGFCMAINRRFLDTVGGFDTVFGRGYGEEVDWCQRARAAGGRHVAALDTVVGHRGGASFGVKAKAAGIRSASRIIARRYPGYDAAVQDWIRTAPVAGQKLALSLAWLGRLGSRPIPVFLGHSLGGGAETALAGEVRDRLSDGAPGVVVIRVGGYRAWRLELHGHDGMQAGDVADTAILRALLAGIPAREVIYSCGVGALDPIMVPRLLLDLASHPEARLGLRLHDFFPISPSWNLIGSDGRYNGPPSPDCTDPAHQTPAIAGRARIRHADWRAAWSMVVDRSDGITVFAPSGGAILSRAFPGAAGKVTIAPHRLTDLPERLESGGTAIGVLGGINQAKGAGVLTRLVHVMGDPPKRRLVLIGEMDGAYRLPRPHVIHGRYDRARIGALAQDYDVGLWLIPSVCPETFSFATHEALATGLPVLCFDIGAQADAVRGAGNGFLVRADPGDAQALLDRIEQVFAQS